MMLEHNFVGNGSRCDRCGGIARHHRQRSRAYHAPVGDPCTKCQRPASAHPSAYHLAWRKARDKERRGRQADQIFGIDGEGHDLPDGRHVYTLLMAVDEAGRVAGEAYNPAGLSMQECARMLLGLPRNALKFVFMGSYDWTKMIEGLSELDIAYIMHPDWRRMRACRDCKHRWHSAEKECPRCKSGKVRAVNLIRYIAKDKTDYPLRAGLDWFNGSFTVAELAPLVMAGPIKPSIPRNTSAKPPRAKSRWGRRTKVWDCFKFFQKSFVGAIRDWKIGTPEQQDRIAAMKKKRGAFADEKPEDVRQYCKEECQLLAQMMREVINACAAAGIELTAYHGAGSIASALMKAHGIKDYMGPPIDTMPPDLQHAIMSAYFGGRFENSIVGEVRGMIYNRDIFSAYPYAIARLPCLKCGTWTYHGAHTALAAARQATLAVVKFRVHRRNRADREKMAWGPLPCREENGSICYPTGFRGWAWLPELETALKGWGDMISIEGCWTYSTACEHQPFAWIPDAYRKRFEWGKDGRGIVMKLGLNACAGKTMQTEGDPPPFRSHIWGGMITATTRSQSAEAILTAKDPWNILGIATDGVFTTEELDLPKPADTGTNDLAKPLGGWGCDKYEHGVFFVKPGMYYSLAEPGADVNAPRALMRARGVGRDEMSTTALRLIDAFRGWNRKSELKINVRSRRFFGAKSSVLLYSACSKCKTTWPGPPSKLCDKCGQVGDRCKSQMMKLRLCAGCGKTWGAGKTCEKCGHGKKRTIPAYGRWAERSIDIEFQSHPKRETITRGGTFGRMRIRDMRGLVSAAYIPGNTTPLGLAAQEATNEALEEPDWYEDEDAPEDD